MITVVRGWLCIFLVVSVGAVAWADLSPYSPIAIRSNYEFLPENGVAAGIGTISSPFIIEGLRIDAIGEACGLLLENTDRPVILRNLEIYGAGVAGIRLQNTRSVRLENVVVRGCTTGILITGSTAISVSGTVVDNCPDGIRIMFSEEVALTNLTVTKAAIGIWLWGTVNSSILDSAVTDGDVGVLLEMGSRGNTVAGNAFLSLRIPAISEGGNAFDDGIRGNFWELFQAPDHDGDGILDISYAIGGDFDRFPLASPPK